MDALRSELAIERVFLQQGSHSDFEKELRRLCQQKDVPLQYVPKERLQKMAGGNHQGVAAYRSLLTYYQLSDFLPLVFEKGQNPLIVVLDGITDVRNFGAIARSAQAFGAQAIVVPKTGTALINADAVKTSAGALLRLTVCREQNLVAAMQYLLDSGVQVFAGDLSASTPLYELDLSGPTAVVLGAEDTGVQPALLKRVTGTFRIPQPGTMDSLNVSVAAGVMLYEAVRQRGAIPL